MEKFPLGKMTEIVNSEMGSNHLKAYDVLYSESNVF